MRGYHLLGAIAIAMTAACNGDSNDPGTETYTATLNGANEKPNAVNTTATGTASLTVNANRTITYTLTQTGMTPTNQHIHGPADANSSAPVIVGVTIGANLTLTPGSFTGAVGYDSLLVLLRAERTYFNIHSATAPGGEIRGNLRRQ